MKRIASFIFSLALLVTSISQLAVSSLAAESPTITCTSKECNPGDTVSIEVNLSNNPGIMYLEITPTYSAELGSPSVQNGSIMSDLTKGKQYVWTADEDVSANGNLLTMTFTVDESVIPGNYSVGFIFRSAYNYDEKLVTFTVIPATVTVKAKPVPVTGIALDRETASIGTGETLTLTPIFSPETATNKNVTWSSSDKTIATVENGIVTPLKKGTTTITVTAEDGGFTDVCVVTVTCAHTSKTQITEKASTCTKKGWDTYSQCDICGQLFDETDNEIDEIPYRALIAHTQSEPVRENEVAATCETAGNYDEVVYCTVCHTEISREMKTILPLEHDWNEGTVTTPATCTKDGVKTFTCKHDVSHTYTKVIPAAGHSPAEAVKENEVAATCETEGSYEEVVYCSVCHAELSRETINILAAGHDWDKGKITMAATCTTDGVRTYTCKHDASHTYTEAISAIGHTPTEAAIENEISATCSFTGSYDEVVYCSVCHEEVSRVTKTMPIDEDAHDWGEWVQTKAPTATKSGEEIRICEHNPSHYETRKIPPVGSNETKYSFLDDEVIIVAPSGAIPEESTFDVQKIVPPPQEIVEKVKNQFGNSSSVLAYYEVRLTTGDGTPIIKLNGEITIKVKIPQEYLRSKSIQLLQEDENGKLVVMTSWWENDYLCYKTDWLEIY